jgi:tyrosinase
MSFGITGVQDGRGQNGSVPIRMEIREMQKNADLWNLYILGLDRLQSVDQRELLSYYQLSGIHGRPYIPWDNVGPSANGWSNGYCTHTSNLFPTWHRPYLALYEQALYVTIQKIVSEFQDSNLRNKYAAAAAKFRIPYWDWAVAVPEGQPTLPSALWSSKTVSVVSPQGGTTTIKNPLYSYKFHPLSSSELPNPPFSRYPETLRYPTSSQPNAESRNNLVDQQLRNSRVTFRDGLYTLFTSYNRFDWFSNKAWIPGNGGQNYNSIESIHDQIHGLTGSGGHMGVVDYSAFDPIFWLHHCMVDRAVAIWQGLWPNSWVETHQALTGTFTIAQGDSEGAQSPLTPFHSDSSGKFWNSDMSRSTKTFGYAYPETVDWNVSPQQYLRNLQATVSRLYSRNAQPPRSLVSKTGLGAIFDGPGDEKPLKPEHPHDQHREHGLKEIKEDAAHAITDILDKLGLTDKDHKYQEWFANIRVKKYALNESFFVHVFIGDFDPEPFSWSFEPKLVGTHCVFVNNPDTTECQKCKDDNEKQIQVTASIPLTTALIDCVKDGDLKSLETGDVEPFLGKNLHWRVTRLNDEPVSREDVPDLKLSVVSVDVKQPDAEEKFPTWGDYKVHPVITAGRPAGLNDDDDV